MFESDLTSDPAVREHVDRVTTESAGVDRRGHPRGHRPARGRLPAARRLAWWAWPRSAPANWLSGTAASTATEAVALVSGLAWRGIGGYPLNDEH